MDVMDKSAVWFAVVNIYAASRTASERWKEAESLLRAKGIEYHGNRTGRSGNAMEITFDACMAGYRKFIAVGGDGTVHDVLNGISSYVDWKSEVGSKISFSDFTIAVIPMGSGNDWIKSTGISKNVSEAVQALIDPEISRQDVVRVSVLDDKDNPLSVTYMVNVGGVGIDARICARVNAQKSRGKRGRILYVTSLIHAIRHRRPAFAKVIADGETVFDGAYLSMAFGVGKYSGGGMRQTPEAVLDDGLLDMTIIPDLPLGRIAREVPRLFTGSFLKVPELISTKSRSITVYPGDSSCAEPAEVDGEVIGKVPVRFDVLDSQINIVVG
jgi:YegS/Rv2252/BmrU family lipid kinase